MTEMSSTPTQAPSLTLAPHEIVADGSDQTFMNDVMSVSQSVPVVVDFWAPWCGPCKQLMPALERAVLAQKGKVKLVKINIDENPAIAGQLGVKSIPAVYAFKDGQPVDGFVGGQPESELNKFVARLTGESDPAEEAQQLVSRAKDSLAAGDPSGAAQDYALALKLYPESAEALAGLARIYIEGGNTEGAAQLVSSAPASIAGHPEIIAVRTSLDLTQDAPAPDESEAILTPLREAVAAKPDDLDARLKLAKALASTGDNAGAVEHLLYSIGKNRAYKNEAARLFLLTIFEAEGTQSPVSIEGRRALSSILFA